MPSDPYNLQRFLTAQGRDYHRAIAEIRLGEKRSHWMWYVFPQIAGLGFSATSRLYAIRSEEEARAYLAHPVLGERLAECFRALLAVEGRTAHDIFGSPDDMKLKSSATLFAAVADSPSTGGATDATETGSVFQQVLGKYFAGERDERTLELLSAA